MSDESPGPGCFLAVLASLVLWGFLIGGAWLLAQGVHALLGR